MSNDDIRWSVELSTGEFHDVGADRCEVVGGALVFYDAADVLLVAYASSYWTAVSAS